MLALYSRHMESRVERNASSIATATANAGIVFGARRGDPSCAKTWVHNGSKIPRASHAAMDGETVGIDKRFSNGARWPGDTGLPAEETCNCHCVVEVK